ncbi:10825_t:CDS:1, partial [Acaulospora colombiana]
GWRLQDRHVLVIGGNQIAANRIEFVLNARPRKITLITPIKNISSNKIRKYIVERTVTHKNSEFERKHLIDENEIPVDLILSAVDDVSLSKEIAAIARELRIPVNVAEIPQICDFLFMPTYREGHLQVAISTNGTGSQVARKLRQHIIESLPKNITSAIDNVALIRQNLGAGNASALFKITDSLPLNELADLTQEDIDRLIAEHKNIELDKSDVSSLSSTTVGDLNDNSTLSIKSSITGNDAFTNGGKKFVDGKTAVAHVAYALSSFNFVYPTTRYHYPGEVTLQWSARDELNAFGKVCSVVQMDTRSGAMTAILGAASFVDSSEIISVFSSSQSIVLMIPNLYGISRKRLSLAIHVSAHSYDDNLENLTDYSDVLLLRDTGMGIINSYSTQEIHDIALITHLISMSTKSPMLHIFDGVRTAHEFSQIDLLSYSKISRISSEILSAANHWPTGDIVDIFEKVASKVGKAIGRRYHAFEYVGSPAAETLLIIYGGGTTIVRETVERISQSGSNVGAIIVRVYRPWSENHFLEVLPRTAKRVAVLEQVPSNVNYSRNASSSLFSDVVATLSGAWINSTGSHPELVDVKYPSQRFNFSTVSLLIKQVETGGIVDFDEILSNKNDGLDIQPISTDVKQCTFWDAESRETFSSSRHIAHILAYHTPLNVSSLSTFDIFNHGGVATTNLQFGNRVNNGRIYDANTGIDFISIHDVSLTAKYDTLAHAKSGAIVLLNTSWTMDDLETKLPNDFRYEASKRNIQLYVIDAEKFVNDLNLSTEVGTSIILQVAFLIIFNGKFKLDRSLEDSIADFYDGNGEKEIRSQVRFIIQETGKALARVELPPTWQILDKTDQILPSFVDNNSFGRNFDKPLIEGPKHLNWHTVAQNLLFKEAYGTDQLTRPDVAEKTYVIRVSENRRLTPVTYDRYLFHIEFDTTGTDLKYDLGEALGVYGHNDPEEVNQFLEYYGLNPDDLISIPNKEGNRYETRTIFQVFSQVLDIFGRPSKRFYESLSLYATNENERDRLLWIASKEGAEEFKRRVADTITYVDLLFEFTSAKPPVEDLVQMVTPIKPRHYSIASAQSIHPNGVHLLVVTVDWVNSAGKKRFGQCTRYLSGLKIGEQVTVSIKPSVMKLPPRDTQPVIMAGLGTGMAPFRAFIEERAYRKSQGKEVGPMVLYFGSRNKSMEYLYGEELEAYHSEGLLSHLQLAFSRDQPHKVYIQHKMNEDANLLHQYLLKDEGWFYLCGPTWPVPDVRDAIVNSFVTVGGLSEGEAIDCINKLKDLERYILEVY